MQLSFEYENNTIIFDVIYSRRKTISIVVEPPGIVRVKAPNGLSDELLISSVQKKAKWIIRKLNEVKNIQLVNKNREFVDGEIFMYLGKEYPLQIHRNSQINKPMVKLLNNKMQITTPQLEKELVKNTVEIWYRQKCKEYIENRIKYYIPKIGKEPNKLTIKKQKSRWGSCSSKGNININWRIIMAPESIIDYIIVHELCHLIHLNHSKQFWNLVCSILPDYKARKNWLKINGSLLE